VLGALFAALAVPRYYFFPAGMLYITWALVRSVLLGLHDRLPGGDPLLDDEEDEDEGTRGRSVDYRDLGPGSRRRHVDEDDGHDIDIDNEPEADNGREDPL
jgi:hypothetical protein